MVGIWFLWWCFSTLLTSSAPSAARIWTSGVPQQRRKLLTWSLLWFLAGPAMILLGYGLFELGVSGYKLPWELLLIFLGLWAYWHVVRQHYGFLRLYQKKNADSHPIDARLDSMLLYAGLLLPSWSTSTGTPRHGCRLAFRRPSRPTRRRRPAVASWRRSTSPTSPRSRGSTGSLPSPP